MNMRLIAAVMVVGVLVFAVLAYRASAAEAAYPPCSVAWPALGGAYGSDNDLAERYGGKPTYLDACFHNGSTVDTWLDVRVYYGVTVYIDRFHSYYSPGGAIWDSFHRTVCSVYC